MTGLGRVVARRTSHISDLASARAVLATVFGCPLFVVNIVIDRARRASPASRRVSRFLVTTMATDPHSDQKKSVRQHGHQLKVWVSDREYERLRLCAQSRKEKVSAIVRRALGMRVLRTGPSAGSVNAESRHRLHKK